MKITIDNLGVVRHIEFDTQKPLSLFCGPNSTGKTYVSYVLYSMFGIVNEIIGWEGDPTSLKDWIEDKEYANYIGSILGVSDEFVDARFSNLKINVSVPDFNNIIYNYPKAVMLTVERNSLYTFKTELSISRNILIDKMMALKDKSNVYLSEMLMSNSRRYPMAVSDSLREAYDLLNIQKIKGIFYDVATILEQTLLRGRVDVTQSGDIEFIVGNNVHLPIQVSSSIVKTLSSLIIYLKYIAKNGDTLFIDEPEMNLHPDNQILLARIFAQMVNMGIKLVISTHSDYIIREFNNLIMANELKLRDNNSWQDYGYTEDMLLNQEKVSVKYFKPNKESDMVDVNDIEVNAYGFAIDSIDDAITLQNDISNEFGNTLNYDYGV